MLSELYKVIELRKNERIEGSYTCYLFEKGLDKILKKVAEECGETLIAAKNGEPEATIEEIADLFYHVLVLMSAQDIPVKSLEDELNRRSAKIGNLKPMRDTDKTT